MKEAIRLRPKGQAYYKLAAIEIRESKLNAVEANLKLALARDPGSAKTYYHMAILLRKLGELDEAKREFQLVPKLRT